MDWTYNTIWEEQLSEGQYKQVIFSKNKSVWEVPSGASYYLINNFHPKAHSFSELSGLTEVVSISFVHSNVHSFVGISRFGKLKRLELFHCVKLERDEGLAEIANDIEWLHINTSKKFVPTDDLYKLKNLKVLCLNDCGGLENLDFLKYFPNLVDFRFVNTNIIDGNLKPLFEQPNLVNVGFLNKRHYNVKESEADLYFNSKSEDAKIYLFKGEFRTFRYDAFGKDSRIS